MKEVLDFLANRHIDKRHLLSTPSRILVVASSVITQLSTSSSRGNLKHCQQVYMRLVTYCLFKPGKKDCYGNKKLDPTCKSKFKNKCELCGNTGFYIRTLRTCLFSNFISSFALVMGALCSLQTFGV